MTTDVPPAVLSSLRGGPTLWAGPLGYRDSQVIEAFWRIVERYRVTAMSGVPTVYAASTGVPVDADISSLATASRGAAALPRAVADARSVAEMLDSYAIERRIIVAAPPARQRVE